MTNALVNDTMLFQHILSNSDCVRWVALTASLTLEYCLKHKMDCHLLVGDQPGRIGETGHWTVPRLIKLFLDLGYSRVIYLDADTVIVDSSVDLREACVPDKIGAVMHNLAYLTPDLSHYNAGALYVTNTKKVRNFMDKWLAQYPGTKEFAWYEQGVFNKLGAEMDIINHLDNRWNAGHVSKSDCPVVAGLHGIPNRFEAIQNVVCTISNKREA